MSFAFMASSHHVTKILKTLNIQTMEGTIGEIRMFAGNFAPLGWMLCNGQSLSISVNEALYSLIGTTYGGDGQQTFNLPDLQSRIAIGAGNAPGLSSYILGETVGTENVTLTTAQMPMHSHNAIVQPGAGGFSAAATLYGVNDNGGEDSPGGNYIGQDSGAGATNYAPGTESAPAAMHAGSIQINNLFAPLPNVTVGISGGSTPHNNIQPVLGMNFIICVEGIYPSRN